MTGHWERVAAAGTDPVALAHVVALAGTAEGRAALRRGPSAIADARVGASARSAADEAARRWIGLDVRVTLPGDAAWPAGLDRLAAPPWFLAARGDAPRAVPRVAIVGARRATSYGTGIAAWLAETVVEAGGVVVSGGARGIDAAAHRAAIAGATVVVLGCGHDVPYPRQHSGTGGMFDQVRDGGGVLLSEQLPGAEPRPGVVRARNRIVAALADLVVVVEGGDRSGALLTATAAAETGVEVLAVPGDVRAPMSAASHRLLREGAAPCTGPDDLLTALAASRPLEVRRGPGADDGTVDAGVSVLPPPVHAELARRWPRPVHLDVLAEAAGVPVGAVLAAVTRGVVAGQLIDDPTGVRLRRVPPTGTGGGERRPQ